MVPGHHSNTTTIASKQLSNLLTGNYVQVIKDEPTLVDDSAGTPRKRQRLDHLTLEEKIMRRKLKNRVAAQTARDRKKMRMDQLEAQLSEMSDHISELTDLTKLLTEQNAALQEKLTRCTCDLAEYRESIPISRKTTNREPQNAEVEGVVIPVNVPTVGSAVSLTLQRAVGTLAVMRIMVLSTLCFQWIITAALGLMYTEIVSSAKSRQMPSQSSQPQHSLPVKKRTAGLKWWGPQQQMWNPTGI